MLEKFSKKPNSMWQFHLSLVQKRDLCKHREFSCACTQGYGTKGLGVALQEWNLRAMWLRGKSKGGSSALTSSRCQHVIPEGGAGTLTLLSVLALLLWALKRGLGVKSTVLSTSFPALTCSCQSLCSEAKAQRYIFQDPAWQLLWQREGARSIHVVKMHTSAPTHICIYTRTSPWNSQVISSEDLL